MPIQNLYHSSEECNSFLVCRNRRPLICFSLGVIFVLAFLFFFVIYPSANITLIVDSQPLRHNFDVKLDAEVNKTLNNLDIMPAQIITFSFKKPKQNYEIKENIDKKLEKKLDKDQVLLPELIHYEEKEGEIFVSALAFKQLDMTEMLNYKISQIVASDKELMVRDDDILKYTVTTFKPNELQAVINVSLQRVIIPKLDLTNLSQKLANQPINDVEKQLNDLNSVKEVKITLKGCFFKKMPLISKRIKLKLDTF